MCGRFTVAKTKELARQQLHGLEVAEWQGPRYNVAPTQSVPAVLNDGRQAVVWIRWGLIPHWSKDAAIGARLINARAETLAQKPAFRDPFRRRRCLVLADGFYEWQGDRPPRIPHYFRLKDGGLFGFAGLWDTWDGPDGRPVTTCTIITTTPNELLARFHDRMPAMLRIGEESAWLAADPPADPAACLRPFPADEMTFHRVSPAVNSPRTDAPGLVEAVGS